MHNRCKVHYFPDVLTFALTTGSPFEAITVSTVGVASASQSSQGVGLRQVSLVGWGQRYGAWHVTTQRRNAYGTRQQYMFRVAPWKGRNNGWHRSLWRSLFMRRVAWSFPKGRDMAWHFSVHVTKLMCLNSFDIPHILQGTMDVCILVPRCFENLQFAWIIHLEQFGTICQECTGMMQI